MNVYKVQPRYLGPDPDPKPPAGEPPKTLTQAEVDAIVAKRLSEEKRKFDQERTTTLERMAKLETDAAAKAELEKQIEDLNTRYKSKDELAADALKKERAERDAKSKATEVERDGWKKRFEEQTLLTDLTTAASKKTKGADGKDIEVHNPQQLVKFLRPDARVTQKVVDGKPVDQLETRIKFTASDGKELDLTPDEVITKMASDPAHGNFFKSGVVGGLGANGGKQGGGNDGLLSMSQEKFTENFLKGTLPKRK